MLSHSEERPFVLSLSKHEREYLRIQCESSAQLTQGRHNLFRKDAHGLSVVQSGPT